MAKGVIWLLIILGSTGVAGGTWYGLFRKKEDVAKPVFAEAKTGDLKITVVTEGSLKPKEFVVIQPEIETMDSSTVVYVVPNGATVKKGDKLVAFDTAELDTQVSRLKIDVQAAQSELVQAKEEVAKGELDRELNVREKNFRLVLAEKELEKYRDLEGPKLIKESEMKLRRAEADLEEAKKNLAEAIEMHKQDLVAESEVKKAELRFKEAENGLESVKMADELLKKFQHPIELQRLSQSLEDAQKSLQSIQPYMESIVQQKKAAVAKAERALSELMEQLAQKEKDVKNCAITSAADGIVNYGSPDRNRWYGEDRPLKAGNKINVHQPLMYIPDLSTMYIDLAVDEMDISKVQKGLPITARCEARPDVALHGVVEEVSQVGSQESWWEQSVKFKVRCSVKESLDWFRPDLKAKVEIFVEELKGVVTVSLDAVFERDGKTVCFVEGGVARPVTVGKSNNDFTEIKEGLQAGERVMLTAPDRP